MTPSAAAGHKPPFPEASAICRLTAVELARQIRERRIPVVEVVGAFLDRIEAVNGAVNAIVSLRGRAEFLPRPTAADLGWPTAPSPGRCSACRSPSRI